MFLFLTPLVSNSVVYSFSIVEEDLTKIRKGGILARRPTALDPAALTGAGAHDRPRTGRAARSLGTHHLPRPGCPQLGRCTHLRRARTRRRLRAAGRLPDEAEWADRTGSTSTVSAQCIRPPGRSGIGQGTGGCPVEALDGSSRAVSQ